MPKIKSAAQTPAPKADRIYGSKTNPKGSASSRKSAKSIILSAKIVDSLKKKLQEFKKSHKKDITINDLKAVYRRGLGAYSSSHRPTITGGAPNTRNAWAMARVNKFLLKAGGAKVKAAYVQDDDLMEDGGNIEEGMSFEDFSAELEKPNQEVIDGYEDTLAELKEKYNEITKTKTYDSGWVGAGRIGFSNKGQAKAKDKYLSQMIEKGKSASKIQDSIKDLEKTLDLYKRGKINENRSPKVFPIPTLRELIRKSKEALESGELKGQTLTENQIYSLKESIESWEKQLSDKTRKHKKLYQEYLDGGGMTKFADGGMAADYKKNALDFFKKELNIKSDVILVQSKSKLETDLSMIQGGVGFKSNDKFKVLINLNDSKWSFIRTLAHELIHIKQMEDGRLIYSNGKISFDGEVITYEEYKQMYHSEEIPKFEEEAFDISRELQNKYYQYEMNEGKFADGGMAADYNYKYLKFFNEQDMDEGVFGKGGKTKGTGDCYEMACQFAMENIFTPKKIDYVGTPYLVQAEVQGQGAISHIRYGHAWIEDDENVYDFSNGRELIIPKDLYYIIGDVETDNPKKYQKYTFEQARRKMLDTKHYGSWDLDVEYAEGGEVEFGKGGKIPEDLRELPYYKGAYKGAEFYSMEDGKYQKMADRWYDLMLRHQSGKKLNKKEFQEFEKISSDLYKSDEYADGGEVLTTKIVEGGGKLYDEMEELAATNLGSWGIPRIALLENGKLVGGIFLGEENLDYEYLFDIAVKKNKRNKGYATILINAMIKDSIENFDLEQIRAHVVNEKLVEILENKYGFDCGYDDNSGTTVCYMDIDKAKQIKYEDGGEVKENDVFCVNCGWGWRFEDSEEFDKYVCHNCDFDNRVFYDSDPVGEISAKLKKPKTLSEIAKIHCVSEESLKPALQKGIQTEKEHTTDDITAETIALHHLEEMPDYYDKLQEMEHSDQPESKYCIWEKKFSTEMAEGGEIEEVGIENYLQTQKEDAETVLFSNKSQLVKNMICNAHIELAEEKIEETESALEKNIWQEVKNIWQETKEEIVDVTFMYEEGGATQKCGCGCGVSSYSRGGLAYGNSHDKGGMPMKVKDTGQDIEIEGGEGVINKRSMQMTKKVEFQGKQMTPCEVISKINQMGGGVKFNCPDVKEIIEKDGDY